MGPVNWLAVLVAAAVALVVAIVWNGRLFKQERKGLGRNGEPTGGYLVVALVMLIGAAMLGHNFARIGSATLDAKPWLYFMQTGGVALAFVIPAVYLSHARNRTEPMRRVIDCAFWMVAYLAMGVVFWALR
ncbi:hypothetical protein WSK_2607 [Novosphingobium sp. Rr 2-17]|uniref:DUF1761 domain-containing protein n=1 Tax=Novosphingobium sp. Rr 2-17 TaxID=555793 RepID=UPI0002698539|nr:DUF1761 domain-containing protein [Novosphingobium sp. Rr 2-17]EIZ78561.1 hypothetical protein WSK_2607 [Novosphingobium sp. Rr 2-17]